MSRYCGLIETTEEKELTDYLHRQSVCPICGKSRQDGGHKEGCPLLKYMRFLPKDLKVGDKVGIPGIDYDEYYPCVVTRIIDDFTCEIYEKSIDRYHIHNAPIMLVDIDGNTHYEG